MAAALLDVNLLFALAWPNHVHHRHADNWFTANRHSGWATCALTELAFLRLSTQPAVVRMMITMPSALAVLEANLAAPEHEFWPMDHSVSEVLPEIRDRIRGPAQLTDGFLLDLAIRRGAKLATFDRRVAGLLPPGSPHEANLQIEPVSD